MISFVRSTTSLLINSLNNILYRIYIYDLCCSQFFIQLWHRPLLVSNVQVGDQTRIQHAFSRRDASRLCAYARGEDAGEEGDKRGNVARAATSIHPVSAMTDDRHYDLSITIVPGIAAIPPPLCPARKLQLMANIDCSRRRDCPPPGWPITHSHQKSAAVDRAANSAKPPPPPALLPLSLSTSVSARRLTVVTNTSIVSRSCRDPSSCLVPPGSVVCMLVKWRFSIRETGLRFATRRKTMEGGWNGF